MTQAVIVRSDGGSRGNPGPAGYGAVLLDAHGEKVLAERGEFLGIASNNVAEYRGAIAGLTLALEYGATDVVLQADSKLVVEQMSGRWKIRHADMRTLALEAQALCRAIGVVRFEWIPRERNTYADKLVNEAIDVAIGSDHAG